MKRRFTEDSWRREPWLNQLVQAVKSSKTEDELKAFLRDVGALSELQAWSERLEVARLLARGWSYRQVARETGASTTTVTRVAHFLENGAGGYRSVLKTHRHHRLPVDTKVNPIKEGEKPIVSSVLEKYLRVPSQFSLPRRGMARESGSDAISI